jgi:iron-sulfur cluster assembly accessory protein
MRHSSLSNPYVIKGDREMATVMEPQLEFTAKALARAKAILEKPENSGKALRVFVFGGGCAGLNYGMAMGFVKPDDYVLESDGFKIVVDPKSMELLKGMNVDYYESIQSSGFKFNNPNAIASCGCGLSFKTAQKTDMAQTKPCH